jgi:hypothetical protein
MLRKLTGENLRSSLSLIFAPIGVSIVGGIVYAFSRKRSRANNEDTVDDLFGYFRVFWHSTAGMGG